MRYAPGHERHSSGRLYRAWCKMRERCENPKHDAFKYYGGRGIAVCARWGSFEAFADDMGAHPGAGWSLDRVSSGGNYEPTNCRWATRLEQARNRRNVRTISGRTAGEIGAACGLSAHTVRGRMARGETLERITRPPGREPMTRCKRGHERSGINIFVRKSGATECRACMRISWTKSNNRSKAK